MGSLLVLGTIAPVTAFAQQVPDAGRVQRENSPPVLAEPGPSEEFDFSALNSTERPQPGGPQLSVARLEFSGNTVFTAGALKSVVQELIQQPLDLAGLRDLTDRISSHYEAVGYPFAKAYLPPQGVKDGTLQVTILEGRYGSIETAGDARLAAGGQSFLRGLERGAPIQSGPLERRLLLLKDQPGVEISPLIRAGEEPGTGDLIVAVSRTPRIVGDVGYDNYGSLYTGEHRALVNLQSDSPFRLGDQVLLRAIKSSESLWLGNVSYSLPIGGSGLRATVGHARTAYELGGVFSSLEASGTADSTSAGLSYSWIRSSSANIVLSATFEHKKLRDETRAVESDERKSSRLVSLGVQFDRRHDNGVIFGSLRVNPGRLKMDSALAALDAQSGRRAKGGFTTFNLDLATLQSVGATGLTFYGRMSAQRSDQNLDSSEKVSLGGPYGVRAYPVSEGNADQGTLLQLELRSSVGSLSPFAFFDVGEAQLNAAPDGLVSKPSKNSRSISGAGLGVRINRGGLSAEAVAAWRLHGGAPLAEDGNAKSRFWLTTSYRFNAR
jgi:hemolysin activation/secretion protein